MDFLQDYFPQALHFYTTYYSPYESYLNPVRRGLLLSQSYFYRYFFPYLWSAYKLSDKALGMLLTDAPNLATLVLLALVLLVSLKILNVVRRTVMYWIGLALRLAFWAAVVLVGVYAWQQGAEQTVEDIAWLIGLVAGLQNQGERIGNTRASRKVGEARGIPRQGRQGRTRGSGWS